MIFKVMGKNNVNRRGKSLTRTEVRQRYLPGKLPRFLKVILDGVFQNFMSTEKNILNVGNNVTSIASIDACIIVEAFAKRRSVFFRR